MKLKNSLLALGTSAAMLFAAHASAQESYDISVIRWEAADIYFNGVQLGQEMEKARIEEKHGVDINFRVFGANDVSEQMNALNAHLSRGVDGVLLVPWRGEAMRGAVKRIREQEGLPVVTSNAWVPEVKQTFVAFGNQQAGRQAGEALVSRLDELRGEDWREEGGVFIELRCIITASFDKGRHRGYMSVLEPIAEKHDNVRIQTEEAGCKGAKARQAVDDIVSREGGENILAVASIDGTMAVGGAVPALKAQDLMYPKDDERHIPIATVDGTVPELKAHARGEIDHTSVQPAIGEGVMTMRLLWQMIQEDRTAMPGADQADQQVIEGDELWMPVEIRSIDAFKGPWYRTSVYTVPGDVSHDNKRIWSNQMHLENKGRLPDYAD